MAKEKKDPADFSVEDKLKNLYQLQTILTEIDKIKTLRGELPLEVQDLEDEIEGLKTRMERLSTEVDDLKSQLVERRADINEAQSLIARYDEQLKSVRNNREYDTLTKEIEFQNLEVELANKKIREATEAIKEHTEQIQAGRQQIEERSEDLDAKKSELEDIVAETRQEEERLREKAKNIEVNIEPRLLSSFKRIRKNTRNGLAVVVVQRDACGGCFNKIPPQRQLDVRMRKKIIVCEYCGRIMVDPELAGIKLASAEEKPKKKRAIRRIAKTEEN
ncbi:MAG: hypothetical protein II530_00825 [Bacteroidaceae bacterium]|nr:hypothetical protein [Bacteroidaceae bacterium]